MILGWPMTLAQLNGFQDQRQLCGRLVVTKRAGVFQRVPHRQFDGRERAGGRTGLIHAVTLTIMYDQALRVTAPFRMRGWAECARACLLAEPGAIGGSDPG